MGAHPAVVRRVGMLATVAAALLTSACAAGQLAGTAYEKPTLDGISTAVGNMDLRGIAIIAPTNSPAYQVGQSASLRIVIVNTGRKADQLLSVTSPAISGWGTSGPQGSAGLSAGPVTVQPGTRVGFGTPETTAKLMLTNLKQILYAGTTVPLTFTFANAGSVTTPVPIALTTTPPSSTVYAPTIPGGSPIQ